MLGSVTVISWPGRIRWGPTNRSIDVVHHLQTVPLTLGNVVTILVHPPAYTKFQATDIRYSPMSVFALIYLLDSRRGILGRDIFLTLPDRSKYDIK
jgi:hypothetical protein